MAGNKYVAFCYIDYDKKYLAYDKEKLPILVDDKTKAHIIISTNNNDDEYMVGLINGYIIGKQTGNMRITPKDTVWHFEYYDALEVHLGT